MLERVIFINSNTFVFSIIIIIISEIFNNIIINDIFNNIIIKDSLKYVIIIIIIIIVCVVGFVVLSKKAIINDYNVEYIFVVFSDFFLNIYLIVNFIVMDVI